MPGSLTTPGRLKARAIAPGPVAFRLMHGVGTQDSFAAQWLACALPCQPLRRGPCGPLSMTRGRCGPLLLHREGLAPSTPGRSPRASHIESARSPNIGDAAPVRDWLFAAKTGLMHCSIASIRSPRRRVLAACAARRGRVR
jgi:hypothetical protein